MRRQGVKILLPVFVCCLVSVACSLSGSAAPPPTPTIPSTAQTETPISPTPSLTPLAASLTQTAAAAASPVRGTIEVAPGGSIIGGTAGSTLTITTVFTATSSAGKVTEMRLDDHDWEPFVPQKQTELTIPLNWSTLQHCVVYRDEKGNLSPQYCDSKAVEGNPQPPQ
jgi:hypothetical protein